MEAEYELGQRTKSPSSGGGTPQGPDTSPGDLESKFDEGWEEVHASEATSVGSNNLKTEVLTAWPQLT